MKTISIIQLILIMNSAVWAQSIERNVIASSGDYFENATQSVSTTLGELMTETFDNGTTIFTQGFQQPGLVLRLWVNLDAFLEGPFNGSGMNTGLTTSNVLPLSQPFNTSPWFYPGAESVVTIPNANIVDWVLIELRDAPNAASATPATIIAKQAGFILDDGSVVSTDGVSYPEFNNIISQQLFVVLTHRNHLSVMSANPLPIQNNTYTYNFSSSVGQAYGSGAQKQIVSGIWGLYGGDVNADGIISIADKTNWMAHAGSSGYLSPDLNLDTQASNQDKNELIISNLGQSVQTPQ